MQNETHCSSLPPNAFTPEFLQALEAREDAPLAALEVASRGSDLTVGTRRDERGHVLASSKNGCRRAAPRSSVTSRSRTRTWRRRGAGCRRRRVAHGAPGGPGARASGDGC